MAVTGVTFDRLSAQLFDPACFVLLPGVTKITALDGTADHDVAWRHGGSYVQAYNVVLDAAIIFQANFYFVCFMGLKKTLHAFCIGLVFPSLFCGLPGGRHDQAILAATVKIVDNQKEYKNIHADVEDGVVTLTGTVELESSRSEIENSIRHVPHVKGVRNQVVLFPPPVLDQVLLHRLLASLKEAGYEDLKIKAHNGAVVLTGTVRTAQDRNRAIQLAWQTDGVREVQAQLSVASF